MPFTIGKLTPAGLNLITLATTENAIKFIKDSKLIINIFSVARITIFFIH